MANTTDDELLAILDKSGIWLTHHGPPATITTTMGTLREALRRAAGLSVKNRSVSLIKTADGGVQIAPEQILRLWRHLGLF